MSKQKKVIEVHIPAILGYEKVAMDSAAAVARLMNFHESRVEDLKTAISEACTNAIEHGNRLRKNTMVLLTLKIREKSLEVNVRDQGRGFQKMVPIPSIDAQLNDCEDNRGWGVFLIKNLVDKVEFMKIPDGGNVTRM